MDSFSQYRCRLSGTALMPSTHWFLVLNLRLTDSRGRFITPNHRPQEVNPQRFPIPQNCVRFRDAARDYVSDQTRSMGINLSDFDLDRIVSCIYRGGAEVNGRSFTVFATISLSPTDVFIGGNERHVIDSDETMILDAIPQTPDMSGSSSSDVSCKNLEKNFKEMKIDKIEAGDEICAICLDGFEKKCSLFRTPCHHFFHHGCIKKWMMKKNSKAECPICRSQILT